MPSALEALHRGTEGEVAQRILTSVEDAYREVQATFTKRWAAHLDRAPTPRELRELETALYAAHGRASRDLLAALQQQTRYARAVSLSELARTLDLRGLRGHGVAASERLLGRQTVLSGRRRRTAVASWLVEVRQRSRAWFNTLRGPAALTRRQVLQRLTETTSQSAYRLDRIAVTELSIAYHDASRRGFAEAIRNGHDVWMRWTELVDDRTWEPLDSRVGFDSMALHGQVAKPGSLFYMPPNQPGVHPGFTGKSWLQPPNRPRDRSTLIPWTPTSGIPAWTYENGRKKWLTRVP